MQQIKYIFLKTFLFLFVPLTIILLPFFFHMSANPDVGPYSYRYYFFLITLFTAGIALCIYIAGKCTARGSYKPLYGALAVIFSTVAVLLIAEAMLRIKFNDAFIEYRTWGHKKSVLFGFEEKPNHSWIAHTSVKNSTDPFGFRTHTQDAAWYKKTTPRIFVMGGSSVWGYGLADNETWPSLLEDKLNQSLKNAPVYVINAANNGYNSIQLLMRLYLKVLPFHPEYVIFYAAVNDISKNILRPEDTFITENILFSETVADYIAKENQSQNLYRKTMIGDWVVLTYKKIKKLTEKGDSLNPLNDAQSYRRSREPNGNRFIHNVRSFVILCSANGVKPILTTFLYNKKDSDKEVGETIDHYNNLIRKLAQEDKVLLIDLADDFKTIENQELYFWQDNYHPNHAGAEYIAQHIAMYFFNKNLIQDIIAHP